MKRLLLSFIFISALVSLSAQEKIWLDKKGEWLNDSIGANRYAIITPEADSNFLVETFTLEDKKKETCHYAYYLKDKKARIRQGLCTYYYKDGSIKETLTYQANRRAGESIEFYPDGNTRIVRHYTKGKLNGEFLQYYQDGKLRRKEYYKEGQCTGGELFAEDGTPLEHQPYEMMPQFPSGLKVLMSLVAKELHYPRDARDAKAEGRVLIQFYINGNGNMEDLKAINMVYPSLETEAVRVLRNIGQKHQWIPAYQDGKAKRVKYTIPILFRL